jgi:predicted nucleic acid-binding protein
MTRIFVDSSILFAACLSQTGASSEIVRQALHRQITLVVSDVVLEETRRNLSELPRKGDEAVAQLGRYLGVVPITKIEATKRQVRALREASVSCLLKSCHLCDVLWAAGIEVLGIGPLTSRTLNLHLTRPGRCCILHLSSKLDSGRFSLWRDVPRPTYACRRS